MALASYLGLLGESESHPMRYQNRLAGKGYFEGEADGAVTNALNICVMDGRCYP